METAARIAEVIQINEQNEANDTVTLKIVIENTQYIPNALLLVSLSDVSGIAFGTSKSPQFSLFTDQPHVYYITCITSMLLKGTYSCNVNLLVLNDEGKYDILDRKEHVCEFVLERDDLLPSSVTGFLAMPDSELKRTRTVRGESEPRGILEAGAGSESKGERTEEPERHVFTIELAGRSIEIRCFYRSVMDMCSDYLVDAAETDICVSTEMAELEQERQQCVESEGYPYPLDQIEKLAVYRKIAAAMIEFDTVLMHGTVAGVGNTAYMVTAKSGMGKTTFLRSFLDSIPGSFVINGDKPLIRVDRNGILACGTPWSGKEGMNHNCGIPLRAIYILERGEKNDISELSVAEAFPYIWHQTYSVGDPEKTLKVMHLVREIMKRVKLYRLQFKYYDSEEDITGEAARMAYDFIESGRSGSGS